MSDQQQRSLGDLLDPRLVAEARRIEIRTRRSMSSDLMGKYRSAFRGSGLVFSDVREYQPGDDVKNIHWKMTARAPGKVLVKSYDEERQLKILLLVDTSRSTQCGSPRSIHSRALEFAALLAMLAKQNQDTVGLCLFSDRVHEFIPATKRRSQLQRVLLNLLARHELEPATDMQGALRYVLQHQKRPAIIFILSDFHCRPFDRELKLLALKHDVICTLVEEGANERLPAAGIVSFVDAESGEHCLLDTSTRQARSFLAASHSQRVAALEQVTRSCGSALLRIGENPLHALSALMERRVARRS